MKHRLLILAMCLLTSLALVTGTLAQDPAHTAGIYVDFGNGDIAMVTVPFTGDVISGTDLLKQSGLPVLTIGFGGFGEGVCMIRTTGCDISSCRRTLCQDGDRQSPFWQYMTQSESGQWTFSPLGASASKVRDGDVNAWVWTGTTPDLPPVTFDEIRARTGTPQGTLPVMFTNFAELNESTNGNRQFLIGGGMIACTIIAGATLVFLQKHRHAAR